MKKVYEERSDGAPVLDSKDDKARDSGTNCSRKDTEPKLPLFRQFVAMLLGSLIGSLIGTILVKILAELL